MIQCQILQTNITRTLKQTVRRIINEILGVKGLTLLCDWSREFVQSSQPTRYNTNKIATWPLQPVFPHFKQFTCLHFDF